MQDCFVLYGVTDTQCVAKVVCGSHFETEWAPIGIDVCFALMWADADSSFQAHAALRRAHQALQQAASYLPRQQGHVARELARRVLGLFASSPGQRYEGIMRRLRGTTLTAHERFALFVAGLE